LPCVSFTRRVPFEFQGKGRVKGDVIIEGTREFDWGRSFAIPEYVPFLILRDPPGDGSSATFTSANEASLAMQVEVRRQHMA